MNTREEFTSEKELTLEGETFMPQQADNPVAVEEKPIELTPESDELKNEHEDDNEVIAAKRKAKWCLLPPEIKEYDPQIKSQILEDSLKGKGDSVLFDEKIFIESDEYKSVIDKEDYSELHKALKAFLDRVLFPQANPALDEEQKALDKEQNEKLFLQLVKYWIQGAGSSTVIGAIKTTLTYSLKTADLYGTITCNESMKLIIENGKIFSIVHISDLAVKYSGEDSVFGKLNIPGHISMRAVSTDTGFKLADITPSNDLLNELVLKKCSIEKFLQKLKHEIAKTKISDEQKQEIEKLESLVKEGEKKKQVFFRELREKFNALNTSIEEIETFSQIHKSNRIEILKRQFIAIEELLKKDINEVEIVDIRLCLEDVRSIKEAQDKVLVSIINNNQFKDVDDKISDKALQLYIDRQLLPDIQKNRDRYLSDVKTEFAKIGLEVNLDDETNQKTLKGLAKGIFENAYGEVESRNKYFPSSREVFTDSCKDALIKFHTFDTMVTTLTDKSARPAMRLELLEDQTKAFLSPNSKIRSGSIVWQFIKDLARKLHLFQSVGEQVTHTTANKVSNKIRFFEELSKDRPKLVKSESEVDEPKFDDLEDGKSKKHLSV